MESKTVQIEFLPDGSVEIDYYEGDKMVGKTYKSPTVPKRLAFFLEKFPKQGNSGKTTQAKDLTKELEVELIKEETSDEAKI